MKIKKNNVVVGYRNFLKKAESRPMWGSSHHTMVAEVNENIHLSITSKKRERTNVIFKDIRNKFNLQFKTL